MNWSDERYVRLFTRDSVTWLSWRWETRCTLSLLLRKVDRSGVLDTGRTDKAKALALTLMMPLDVVSVALNELLESGTAEVADGSIILPNFISAQEAIISDRQRQKDLRERRLAETRANERNNEGARHAVSRGVTDGHAVSRGVTPAVPSRAVPSLPSQTTIVEDKPRPVVVVLEETLTADELDVWECWRVECHHPKAVLTRLRLRLIRQWLPVYGVTRLQRAIRGCSRSPHHQGKNDRNTRYDSIELILRDAKRIEDFEAMP